MEKNVERAAILLKPNLTPRRRHEQATIPDTAHTLMSNSFDSSLPSDIRLLLRADAEQCWLHREVIPVLHHLEAPSSSRGGSRGGAGLPGGDVGRGDAARAGDRRRSRPPVCALRAERRRCRAPPAATTPRCALCAGRCRARQTVRGRGACCEKARGRALRRRPAPSDTLGNDMRVNDARPNGCPRAA